MLSIGALASAAQGASYYERDGYYAKDDPEHREASAWAGRGAEELGLTGPVDPDTFRAVLEGKVPDGSGQELGRRGKDGEILHRPGRDLTFSAPKSVSLAALVGGDGRIVEAHDRAVAATLAWVEKHAAETRMKDPDAGRMGRVGNQKIVAALFRHDTSRNLDPQLHTHAVLANMVKGEDGKWRSMANEGLRARRARNCGDRRIPRLAFQIGRAPRQEPRRKANGRAALLPPGEEGSRQRIVQLHLVVRQREESGQRIGMERGEPGRRYPVQEGARRRAVRARRVQPDGHVHVVGDMARVARLPHGRPERADREPGPGIEARDLPAPRRIDRRAAGGEQRLALPVAPRPVSLAQVAAPPGQGPEGRDPGLAGELLPARDQGPAALLALPVVRPDIVVAHGRGLPPVAEAERHRNQGAVRAESFENREERCFGLGRFEPEPAKRVPVVEEAVDHRSHRHAEGDRPVIGLPGGFGGVREMGHARQIAEIGKMPGLVQGQGSIERAAGDQIAGGTRREPGLQDRVVVGRRRRPELQTDRRMGGLEGRHDPFLPDRPVVVPPAVEDKGRPGGGRGSEGRDRQKYRYAERSHPPPSRSRKLPDVGTPNPHADRPSYSIGADLYLGPSRRETGVAFRRSSRNARCTGAGSGSEPPPRASRQPVPVLRASGSIPDCAVARGGSVRSSAGSSRADCGSGAGGRTGAAPPAGRWRRSDAQ